MASEYDALLDVPKQSEYDALLTEAPQPQAPSAPVPFVKAERAPFALPIAKAIDYAAGKLTGGRAGGLAKLVEESTREPAPGETSFTNLGIPTVPQQETLPAQIAAGAANIPIGAANFLLSPGGAIGTEGLAVAPKAIRTLAGVLFGGQQAVEAVKAPTLQGKITAAGTAGLIGAGTLADALFGKAKAEGEAPIPEQAAGEAAEPRPSFAEATEGRPIETEQAAKEVIQQNAIQEPSTGAVLQREPQETTATGSERLGVEQSVQGQETPKASAQEIAREVPGAQFEQPVTTEGKAVENVPQPEQPPELSPQQIPDNAKVEVKFRTADKGEVVREMNAREAHGIFEKERSSYRALIDCLGR